MRAHPFFSICIPAYKRAACLQRLLDSIAIQSYNDFEVIVTDDSPDRSVESLILRYADRLPVRYFRNESPLGTPENWNEAVRHAQGEWIKIMHDDDWFVNSDSLNAFAEAIRLNPQASFVFSAYRNVYPDGHGRSIFAPAIRRKVVLNDPRVLFAGNTIGPPSCTAFKRREGVLFDNHLKWLVDIDFYIEYLKHGEAWYIPDALVNIGVSDQQVTAASFRNPMVEIPESFRLLNKTGEDSLRNWRLWDAWWRLLRNLSIRDPEDIVRAGYPGAIPEPIGSMIRFQRRIPAAILRMGVFSKLLMTLHRMVSCLLFLLLVAILPTAALSAQDLHSYAHYDVADGLTGSTVYCMAQDKDGFIWFGTETGLSRFDGGQFTNFTVESGLPDNEVLNLFVDSRNRVWIMPFRSTIAYYWKGRIYDQRTDPVLARIRLSGKITNIVEDAAGNILLVEQKCAHLIRPDGTVALIRELRGYLWFAILNAGAKKGGGFRVSVFCPGEVALADLEGNQFVPIDTIGKSAGTTPLNCYMSSTGMTRSVNDSVLVFMDADGKEEFRLPPIGGILSVSHLDDSLFMVNTNRYNYLFDIRKREIIDSFLKGQTVNAAIEDMEGNIWFSTLGNGVFRLGSRDIRDYSALFRAEYARGPVFCIREWDSILYLGSDHFMLWSLDLHSGHVRSMRLTTSISRGRVMDIARGFGDKTVAGTDYGMFLFDRFGGKVRRPSRSDSADMPHSIKALTHLSDSTILDVGDQAVRRIISSGFIHFDTVWKERSTSAIWLNNHYYIGTLTGLYAVDPNKSSTFLGDRYPVLSTKITALANSPDGTLWIGTDGGGLVGYKDGRIVAQITRNNGLTSNVCRAIFATATAVWLGTDRGLNKIRFVDTGVVCTPFTKSDGLGSDIINTVYVKNDDVFVGNADGLVWFNEKKISRRSICLLKITSITVSQRAWTPDTTDFVLPHADNNIRIGFAGISLRSAGNINYEYRLIGPDKDWRSTRENFLTYPSLPSGSYELELQAINKFGVHSEPVSIRFSVERLWWEKAGFRITIGLALAALVWMIFAWRVRVIRNKEEEKSLTVARMAELEQMALRSQMNPHFIFNCLNSIQQYVMEKDVRGVNEFITNFARLIRQTLDFSSRPFISLQQEIGYLSTYLELEKGRFENRFDYRVDVEEGMDTEFYEIPPMILQPYVENAIRHGMGLRKDKNGMIDIRISIRSGFLVCSIEDNGVGRKLARQFRSSNAIEYQSRGMSLTEKRIEMFNQTGQTGQAPVRILVEDLENDRLEALGTRVTLFFPLDNVSTNFNEPTS
ncbi:MAG: histidine kinase [Bacteroidota bacterium]|nr:histidine kinase [Bacteroidota bacterium]MDP4245000.1 histidine kinase [Bacteroidota bacterium]MDP4259117.1 histidine kinase [Bacteroidota bacterium]